jgi:hypothetical protein
MLNDIEVLDKPDTNFWMATAYTIPDTPHANVQPGQTGFKSVPINRMVPRSFITNIKAGDTFKAGVSTLVRGIAFGGDTGVARVDFSGDHSAGMVLTQPALSPMQWRTEVEKMRTAYKAPIDAKDIDTIVNYLVALQPAR